MIDDYTLCRRLAQGVIFFEEGGVSVFEELEQMLQDKHFSELKKKMAKMEPADIVLFFESVEREDALRAFRILPKELAAETFADMEHDMQEDLIESFSASELSEVLDEMYLDDTVDVIEEMPASIVKRIISHLNPEDRKIVNKLLRYPEDSAGSIMTPEYVSLKPFFTVDDALMRIRRTGVDKETIYTCYVTSESNVLMGVVTVKDILLAEEDALIGDIMDKDIISVETGVDQEKVAKMFDKYDFLAMPVVDKENRLVGIVTVDDAMDVMQEENTEDFEKMAAMLPSEDSYFKTSVFKHARNRILWLIILMISGTFTGMIIEKYENAFHLFPLLVSFVPMLMDTGGNSGSQTSTLMIRGMAIDTIHPRDVLKVWFKEIRVALLVGTALALVNTARMYLIYFSSHPMGEITRYALLLGITIIFVVCFAKTLGCLLPLGAKAIKLDPALMASPLITTITDCATVLMYFTLAVKIMNIQM